MADLSGKTIGRYHLIEKLGEGGMAVVYKAFDTRLETDVAVKIIRMEKLTEETRERALKRFEREAKALAKLTHPNIVKVMDYGEYEGKPYLVMEYLSGGTLKQQLGTPIPWEEAFRTLAPIARALEYAHRREIIHRDVKASNILMTDSGQPMIADFGVAKILSDTNETLDLTGTGMGVGTPEYMAPEQWNGKTSPASDQYSLGVVLYEMITGRKPYVAETPAAILLKQAMEELPRPSRFVADLPERAENVLFKALARETNNRYADMGELAAVLENQQVIPEKAQSKPRPPRMVEEASEIRTQDLTRRGTEKKLSVPDEAAFPEKKNNLTWFGWIVGGLAIVISVVISVQYLIQTGENQNNPSVDFPTPSVTMTPAQPLLTNTPEATVTPELGIGSTMIGEDGMVLVYVPAGEFIMGSNTGSDNEKPEHEVYLDAYWIDQTEVTNAMFASFVEQTGYITDAENTGASQVYIVGNNISQRVGVNWLHPFNKTDTLSGMDNYPVVHVSWNDAKAYCEWAGRRLPSEAEWEKAARGTEGKEYPWGEDVPNARLLNVNELNVNEIGKAGEVGSYPEGASEYGAFDMAGNVWEWVSDWYDESYYQTSPSENPQGPNTGEYRVKRGGTWFAVHGIRSAFRFWSSPSFTIDFNGFRCSRGTSP